MVLVDLKPPGLKEEAKIQWTAAQLIGCLLVCFFNVLSPQVLFLELRQRDLFKKLFLKKKEKKDLFKKFGSARKFPTATVKVKGGNFNQ